MAELILASQSPRRKELLEAAGIEFTVRVRPVEEIHKTGESPVDYVRRLAREKANAVWERLDEVVLGADTIVVLDEHILEKPRDFDDAVRMLTMLAGREHSVITGICLRHAAGAIVDHAETRVRFLPMTALEIEEYVRSGEPMDKAGAYAIQGLASKFVERIDGCYFNVVGLPVSLVHGYWKKLN
jgi:septum formation protein